MTTCVCGLGWVVGRLDVTLITVGWRNLLATSMDSCGGHCHTQSEVRPEGCVCLCLCIILLSGLAITGPGARERATLGVSLGKYLSLRRQARG